MHSVRESLLLSPWDKWKKYRRPPWKFFVQMLLIIAVTTQLLLLSAEYTVYSRSAREALRDVLNPKRCTTGLYSVSSTVGCVRSAVDGYFNFTQNSVGLFRVPGDNETESHAAVHLSVTSLEGVKSGKESEQSYTLERTDYGPFDWTGQRFTDWFDRIVHFSLRFVIFGTKVGGMEDSMEFEWVVWTHYDFQDRGGEVVVSYRDGESVRDIEGTSFWLTSFPNIVVLVLASLSLILSVKGLIDAIRRYLYTRRHLGISWQTLPIGHKLRFFNLWFLVTILADIFLIVSCIFAFFQNSRGSVLTPGASAASSVFLGIGTLLLWCTLLQYLEYSRSFNVVITTMRKAMPRVTRYVISVMPVYMGYTLAGLAMFSHYSERFSTLTKVALTLFAVLNGDEILATYQSLYPYPYQIVANVYMYSFCILFITSILNLFIFIIEDAYHLAKGIPDEAEAALPKEPISNPEHKAWDEILTSMDNVYIGGSKHSLNSNDIDRADVIYEESDEEEQSRMNDSDLLSASDIRVVNLIPGPSSINGGADVAQLTETLLENDHLVNNFEGSAIIGGSGMYTDATHALAEARRSSPAPLRPPSRNSADGHAVRQRSASRTSSLSGMHAGVTSPAAASGDGGGDIAELVHLVRAQLAANERKLDQALADMRDDYNSFKLDILSKLEKQQVADAHNESSES